MITPDNLIRRISADVVDLRQLHDEDPVAAERIRQALIAELMAMAAGERSLSEKARGR